jgi:hypothetical protein
MIKPRLLYGILAVVIFLLFIKNKSNYSPTKCTITNYDFTWLFDKTTQTFKIHGLWPNACSECLSCGWPSCCNIENIVYVYPDDPYNFIGNYWFNTTTTEECTETKDVILFEHEYYKHISCTDIGNTTNFLNLVMELYKKYYIANATSNCIGYEQLWINIDQDFNYNNLTCKN